MKSKVKMRMLVKKFTNLIQSKWHVSFVVLLCVANYSTPANAQVIGASLEANVSEGESTENRSALIDPPRLLNEATAARANFSLSDDLQFKPGKALDQNNYIAKAQIWSKGVWGLSGNIQENDLNVFGLPKESDSKRIDVNRKVLKSTSSDSFLALGLGWQSYTVENLIESDGLNLSLLGQYSFTDNFLFYGNGTVFQSFDTSYSDDFSGYQLEAGLNYNVGSRLSFSAGVRVYDLEGQQNLQERRSFSSSVLIGTSLSF